jgi:hypothetical protein
MNDHDEMHVWFDINKVILRYWADVNRNNGERAHEFYESEGYFMVGEKRHSGRAGIQAFYRWRAERGARVARHLVTNVLVAPGSGPDEATATGSVCLFAADGVPIMESNPPTMVADFHALCVRDAADGWLFRAHVLTPLFRGGGRLVQAAAHGTSPQ